MCVVHGEKGVGKTTLAARYSKRIDKEYVVRWIGAENCSQILVAYHQLAHDLGLDVHWQRGKVADQGAKYRCKLARVVHEGLSKVCGLALLVFVNVAQPDIISDYLRDLPSVV